LRPLVLSHSCIATSIGLGLAATVAALRSGGSGLVPCRFETVDLPTYIGKVDAADSAGPKEEGDGSACRNSRLAAVALAQDGFAAAVEAAREKYGPERVAVLLGTSTSGILASEVAYRERDAATGALPAWFDYAASHNTYSLGAFVAQRFGLRGPAAVVSCACASTAKVFASAARLIEAGLCDAAIVGGADSLCLTTLYGFRSLFLTAETPCRPFDAARDGISIGEAAGFALLEKADSYEGIDSPVLLLGVGESNDAYHMSAPHPEGMGARLAMERALAAAGLRPKDIDYVNMHGTATKAGDAAEDCAVADLFGRETACSSTKGQTGHTLGAAGIVEALFSALAIQHDFIPGGAYTEVLDPTLRSRYLRRTETAVLRQIMSNSFGFGGSNCSLVLGRAR
jgi:3-oxoacyl-[acyl-carrier-protein] synthase-1